MRQAFAFFGAIILCLTACKKENDSSSIIGLYNEQAPVAGRSQLHFVNDTLLVRMEAGSPSRDSFRYSISTGKILMTPLWTIQYPGTELEFERIDNNTIKIENQYVIGIGPKTYMTYIR
jgi:hypothetical protein